MHPYPEEQSLLARIAWMYYIQGLTQEQIAARLNYSRPKVTRLLAKAKHEGIVEVRINSEYRSCLDIEEALRSRFGLREVLVVPTGSTLDETRAGVGTACANLLERILEDDDVLGCSWGWNLYNVGQSLKPQTSKHLTVVQLLGGLNISERINPQRILELIASKLHATGVWLNTPAIVDTPEIKNALLSDDGVRKTLEQGKKCTKALVGIGDMTHQTSLIESNALTINEMEELQATGAVGNIMAWFFDIHGFQIFHSISERLLAISLEDLRNIPLRIGCTAGMMKARAIFGAICGRYINALVTDEATAIEVLKL